MAGPAPEAPNPVLQQLPAELQVQGRALVEALPDSPLLSQAFATFCSAAYVKPDLAGPASDFLAELFADHEDLLADMARIPDLIIELASGHYTLTFMVASRWAAKNDTSRMVRLAEALVATQSKMSGPEVVDIMLALTTSLAVTRYPRAEQLYAAAEPHATEEHQEAMAEARLWLAAGRVVRLCTQEARDIWDQRLRRSRVPWTWEAREEREALSQLANHLDMTMEGAELFKAVVPPCWWDLAVVRVRELARQEELAASVAAKPTERLAMTPPSTEPQINHDLPPVIVWNAWPFFFGGLVGAAALAVGIWLGPYDLVKNVLTSTRAASSEPVAVAKGGSSVGGGAPASAPETPAATVGASTPAGEAAKPEEPAVPLTPEQQQIAEERDVWRKTEVGRLAGELPELEPVIENLKKGTWDQYQAYLAGETPEMPKEDSKYQRLLLWLHLDPPQDPVLRGKIPSLLAALRQDTLLLDLWSKLNYAGSPNAGDIREAAKRQLHENTSAWSPSQKNTLNELAGWTSAPAAATPAPSAAGPVIPPAGVVMPLDVPPAPEPGATLPPPVLPEGPLPVPPPPPAPSSQGAAETARPEE